MNDSKLGGSFLATNKRIQSLEGLRSIMIFLIVLSHMEFLKYCNFGHAYELYWHNPTIAGLLVKEDREMAGLFRGSRSGVWDAAAQNARPLWMPLLRMPGRCLWRFGGLPRGRAGWSL